MSPSGIEVAMSQTVHDQTASQSLTPGRSVPGEGAGPVDRFLAAVVTAGIPACDSWAADATLDATVPNWRFHRQGAEQIRETYAEWFADPGSFEELVRQPVPGGEVVRYLLAWEEDGVPHTAHHAHFLQVADGRIVADVVLCGGRWPAALMAEMEAADAG